MPKVSVIVPNYNHAPYLMQRIDSILAQTYQDFELILLDDCSTDNSREVLLMYKEHPKVSLVLFNEQNSGTAFKQWNKGIGLANGEYIWIAESDDWAEDEFLEKLLGEIERNPSVGLAYTFASYISAKGEQLWDIDETGKTKLFSGSDYIENKLLIRNSICNVSTVIFKRSLFDSINNSLYENMKLCGDWFFYVLLCENTNVLELQKVYSHYRIHDENVSTTGEKSGKSFLEGIEILDYICSIQSDLSVFSYSFEWARQWIKYKKQYLFTTETNRTIIKCLRGNHKLILMNYYLLNTFYSLKRK